MSGRVPPSSRAGKKLPAKTDYQKAVSRFERFTGHDAEEVGRVKIPPLPKVVAMIGTATALCYSTVRDGKLQHFKHEFAHKDAPLFCVSPDGKQILLVGGNFTFTERGIVDRSWKD